MAAAILFIAGPIVGLVFWSWGLGAVVFGAGAIVLGIRQVLLGDNRGERFLGVALDFQTWRTMVRGQGLSDEEAIEVLARMVRCPMRT